MAKTLAEWFPNNGMFTQAGRVMSSMYDASGPRTLRHHPDTFLMSTISTVLPASHTPDSVYTEVEIQAYKIKCNSVHTIGN